VATDITKTVTVIGAGATGLALGMELQQRDISVLLLDKGEPGMGATCHSAGVLHSGVRYALTDPALAKACYDSQRIFLQMAPFTITNSREAYYLITTPDSEAHAENLTRACADLNIPLRYISREDIRHSEPRLRIDCAGALGVKDLTVDPFLLISSYVEEATDAGTDIIPVAEILSATRRANCWELRIFEPLTNRFRDIVSTIIVVAAGPWSGTVLARFGIALNLRYVNGCMFVLNDKVVDRIITFCQPPSSCDSLIPCYSHALLGSTWTQQSTPEPLGPLSTDQNLAASTLSMLLGESYAPAISHAYSGVRVILPTDSTSSSAVSRETKRNSYLLDHEELNGVSNLISVFGGKLTLHQAMAEHAAKLVCEKLGIVDRKSVRTAPLKIPKRPPTDHLAKVRK
jgi:glycerol-3-phosphate dehydrogenase